MTELQLEFIRKFGSKDLSFWCWITVDGNQVPVKYDNSYLWYSPDEILGHPVQWHDVFTRLRDMGYESFLWSESLLIDPDEKKWEKKNIEVDKYISPMLQPTLIKQLLLLTK